MGTYASDGAYGGQPSLTSEGAREHWEIEAITLAAPRASRASASVRVFAFWQWFRIQLTAQLLNMAPNNQDESRRGRLFPSTTRASRAIRLIEHATISRAKPEVTLGPTQ